MTLPSYQASLLLLAAVTGLGLMAAGRASRKTQLPFGPFLIAATLGAALAVGIPG